MKPLLAAAALALILYAPAEAQDTAPRDAASPQGVWMRGDGKARVRIAPCGDDLCAVNLWIRPGVHNEKVGDKLVMSVRQDKDAHWTGKAYDPQRKLTYKLTMILSDASRMTTSGCVLGGLICKDAHWTRVDGEGRDQG
jgi:uncharacterized protein (DUF2147 family)